MRITFNSIVLFILCSIFVLLNYKIWVADSGASKLIQIYALIEQQKAMNASIRADNDVVMTEVDSLKNDDDVIEYAARADLGMIAPNEMYYQFS